MGSKKLRGILLMALCAEWPRRFPGQSRQVGTMRCVTGRAILSRGGVRRPLLPEFGDVAMTAETEDRQSCLHKAGMRRLMAAVTGIALQFGYRAVLDLVTAKRRFSLRMT